MTEARIYYDKRANRWRLVWTVVTATARLVNCPGFHREEQAAAEAERLNLKVVTA